MTLNFGASSQLRFARKLIASSAILFLCVAAHAQTEQTEDIDPKFDAQRHEIAVICGEFLPNQIPGVTEMMPLCGGRVGFKTGHRTYFEPQLLGGNAKSQRYLLTSIGFRNDFQLDDIIGSVYGGGDMHYMTRPMTDPQTLATADQTDIFFGLHFGGALWAQISEHVYFRTDLQFNVNPGTSLFVGFSLVMRFDSGSNDQVGGVGTTQSQP